MKGFLTNLFLLVVIALPFANYETSCAAAQDIKITGVAPKVKKFVAGTVRAYSLGSSAVYGKDLSSKRSFQLSVPAGGYVVLTDVLGKREKASRISVVAAQRGKRTAGRPLAATSEPSIRVSVGNILLKTANGKTVKAVNGKNIVVDDLFIVDLLNSRNECGFAVVEDRKFGRFKDVLKEIKLQASKLSASKINYRSAIATLNANAPQFRITGSVEVNDQQDLTGNSSLQIVNLQTDAVIWQKSFTGGSTSLSNFSEPLAQAVADAICIPQKIAGSFTGVQKLDGAGYSVTYSWRGDAVFKLISYIASDPLKPNDMDVALYQFLDGEIVSYTVNGTNNGCSVSGAVGSQKAEFPSTGAMMVYLNPVAGLGYKYSLATSLIKDNAIQITNTCPDGTSSEVEPATAELITSKSEEDLPATLTLQSYSGSITTLDTEIHWNFNAQP